MGDGSYVPRGTSTGHHVAKMLLAAMGERGLTGSGWAQATDAAAKKWDLYDGITADMSKNVTRDDAARLIFNALLVSDGAFALPSIVLVRETEAADTFTVPENALIIAPEGKQVTMLKDGVETGFEAGEYKNVKLVVTDDFSFTYTNSAGRTSTWDLDYRTALYIDENGVDKAKSVLGAVTQGTHDESSADGVVITSRGENFNGIIVTGDAEYVINDPVIRFEGNGGSDFKGFGAGIMAIGNARVIIDGADIETTGVVRTGIVAGQAARLLVKNSVIATNEGVLPDDYEGTVDTSRMKSVPWMLGLDGNCRATNLLDDAVVTYYHSHLTAEKWGVLSTDDNRGVQLAAVNSKVEVLGDSGYGAYSIGDTLVTYAGSEINVPDYAGMCANGNSSITFTDSSAESLADIYGLADETVEQRTTVVNSGRFGVMYHSSSGGGVTRVDKGTVFNTELTAFLVKGCATSILVDEAEIKAGNNVILQLMDNDDPGPNIQHNMLNNLPYIEPEGTPEKVKTDAELAAVNKGHDVMAKFSDMELKGDMYNSTGYADASSGSGGSLGGGSTSAKNLGIEFINADYAGVISSSKAMHSQKRIEPHEYQLIGMVTNEACHAINNGVSVSLGAGSKWTVTGTCYINSLDIAGDAQLLGLDGKTVTMTVNGVETEIEAGASYTGFIVITIA